MIKLLISTVFLSFILINNSYAQTEDLELWTGVSIKTKLVKNLSTSFDLQSRFNQNATVNSNNFGQFNLSYDLAKKISLSGSYRLAFKNNLTNYLTQNRLSLNVNFNQKIKPLNLKFKLRARYQFGFNRLQTINESIIPDYSKTVRIKTTLEYKIKSVKKIRPGIGLELFFEQDPNLFNEQIPFRLFGAIEWDIHKRQVIKFKYIYEAENNTTQNINHIYAIAYTYQLKGKLFN